MKAGYVAGQRNIGPNEVERRQRHGVIAAAASILLLFLLLWTGAPRLARLLLAGPILFAVLGFVQASNET